MAFVKTPHLLSNPPIDLLVDLLQMDSLLVLVIAASVCAGNDSCPRRRIAQQHGCACTARRWVVLVVLHPQAKHVKSTCDAASSTPKPCPTHARCANGFTVDCQATDQTGLFVVSDEGHANCVLSKGEAIVDSINSQLVDLAVEGKCDDLASGNDNSKPTIDPGVWPSVFPG